MGSPNSSFQKEEPPHTHTHTHKLPHTLFCPCPVRSTITAHKRLLVGFPWSSPKYVLEAGTMYFWNKWGKLIKHRLMKIDVGSLGRVLVHHLQTPNAVAFCHSLSLTPTYDLFLIFHSQIRLCRGHATGREDTCIWVWKFNTIWINLHIFWVGNRSIKENIMLISLGNSTCFQFKIHTFCSIFLYNLTLFQEALHLIDSKQK